MPVLLSSYPPPWKTCIMILTGMLLISFESFDLKFFLPVGLSFQASPVQISEPKPFLSIMGHRSSGRERRKIWESSHLLPDWMKEYFAWHSEQRLLLNESNWKEFRYYVMRCLAKDTDCGGTSDRLQQLPLLLLHAHKMKRLLFFKWEKPAPLEEFLEPPPGGMDWRIPAWLDEHFEFPEIVQVGGLQPPDFQSDVILMDKLGHAGVTQGQEPYEDLLRNESFTKPTYDRLYHDCWSTVFQPTKPVRSLIEKHLKEISLKANNYTSLHIRSQYLVNDTHRKPLVQSAVACAAQLHPSATIFVVSDHTHVTYMALEYGKAHGIPIVTRTYDQEPMHMDRGADFLADDKRIGVQAADRLYDSFVDLYLLALGGCTAYGVGGYGLMANRMSTNVTCAVKYTGPNYGRNEVVECLPVPAGIKTSEPT